MSHLLLVDGGNTVQEKKGSFSVSPIRMKKIESALRVVLEFNDAFNRHSLSPLTFIHI